MIDETFVVGVGDDPPRVRLIYGVDVLSGLRSLDAKSVHTVCTSPPYFGLRDYGTGTWVGGDSVCQHRVGDSVPDTKNPKPFVTGLRPGCDAWTCLKCGATRQDLQIGLEQVPDCLGWASKDPCGECYVCHVVTVFREIRRVLRDDGSIFLNLGDSYANDTKWGGASGGKHVEALHGDTRVGRGKRNTGLKQKDLIGVPWRVAFALQADGWYLRSDIIWAKGNCMPEAVQDRPTKSHEYVFLLTKESRYFYDIDAIREPHKFNRWGTTRLTDSAVLSAVYEGKAGSTSSLREGASNFHPEGGRNKRTVWNVNPKPYAGAHFAVWPEKLVEPMILAGSSEYGCCSRCLSPWKRIVETSGGRDWHKDRMESKGIPGERLGDGGNKRGQSSEPLNDVKQRVAIGWEPSCDCDVNTIRCTVLDPFSGSATTGAVAVKLGRNYIGIDLNLEYLQLAKARVSEESVPNLKTIEDDLITEMFGD